MRKQTGWFVLVAVTMAVLGMSSLGVAGEAPATPAGEQDVAMPEGWAAPALELPQEPACGWTLLESTTEIDAVCQCKRNSDCRCPSGSMPICVGAGVVCGVCTCWT